MEPPARAAERFSVDLFQAAPGLLRGRRVVPVEGDTRRRRGRLEAAIVPLERRRRPRRVPRDRPRASGGGAAGADAGQVRPGPRPGVRGGLHPAVLAGGHGRLQGLQRQRGEGGECEEGNSTAGRFLALITP